ncbi:MAG: ABC transporter permease [Planctomycetota bacterium]
MSATDPQQATTQPGAPPIDEGESAGAIAWRMFRRNALARASLVVIHVLFGIAVFAPLIASGKPLFLRAHDTSAYEADVAAFLDWHRRLLEAQRALERGVGVTQTARLEADRARFQRGLPEVLARLEGHLPRVERADFALLREDYASLAGRLELTQLAELGDEIAREYCARSALSAYKGVAAPLLEVGPWTEALDDARREDDPALLEGIQAEGRALADEVAQGLAAFVRFRPAPEQASFGELATPLLTGMREGGADPGALRAHARALELALDAAVDQPVPGAAQLLPPVTAFPALRHLSAVDVGFMVFYVLLSAMWIGSRAFKGWSTGARALALLGPSLLAALGFRAVFPPTFPPGDSFYKALAHEVARDEAGDGVVVFPLVPFGENENIYQDRHTPPALWEGVQLGAWESAVAAAGERAEDVPRPPAARRFQEPHEPPLTPNQVRQRWTRLRSHWLGTDGNGRDVLARLIMGSRVSLSVGFVSVAIYLLIGIVLGAISGYFRGWVDIVISRFTEIVICFPRLPLIIAVMALFDKPSIFYIMAIIGLTSWTEVMRLVRAEFLRLGGLDFVAAARSQGLSSPRILFRHLLPNAMGPVFVAGAFGVAGAILVESALSFLGFGVPPPQASWGSVLHDSRGQEQVLWWVTIFPGLLIFVTVTAYNLVGEGLRDALDPRLRQ